MIETIDFGLLLAPFCAGLLVLATHVPLGREVLRRGIIFIDLAIAQVAGLGVMAAHLAGWGDADGGIDLATQATAVAAAVCGALLLTWSGRRWPEIQEALIGLLFAVSACVGILLLAHNPHGGEHLRDLLAGQILWVSWGQLLLPAVVYAFVLVVWFQVGPRLGDTGFYLLFALTVTLSVQLVGVFLVFASLIAPALASRRLAGNRGLFRGYIAGIIAYAIGLVASSVADLPPGPTVVCVLGLAAMLSLIAGSKEVN